MNFIGREKELKILEDFVYKSKINVLYLYGNRGIGKTSLIYRFIETQRSRIGDDYYLINISNESSLADLEKIQKRLLVIDGLFEDIYISASFLRNIAEFNFRKVIIVTNQFPLPYDTDIQKVKDTVYFLELKGLNNYEIINIIKQRLGEKQFHKNASLFNSEFLSYFDNNPTLVLTALNFLKDKKDLSFSDFKSYLETPLQQTGIIDVSGNPISRESGQLRKVEQKIKLVNSSLIDKAYRNPDFIYKIKPHQFEELVAELLEKEGFDVNLTKKTHDGGKDIFIAKNSILGNFLFYIECKQYSPDFHVGVKLVRELYGTVTADRATAGLLVTTSYFSKQAIDFVENIRHQMSLKDFLELKKWINDIYLKKYSA